ncbi:hypothetical protein TpMuguga_02g00053 [Theileria parva strain Muguga]|uniref:Uncharacterized protein n=1 Tax=Theileria parva TaxID=5875 RepID=Q4N684_THEPA|nr:uncharacterized protein TpMuguga_02g00053 [Theileria parva strain Muguga]EAN32339.1 hypothetical protein TpMuguga_02g00053 [Theileria parva strain Muguga]|eukprot:XP_764622.1 hypothetical protein [Theileria parva strain Muguga]
MSINNGFPNKNLINCSCDIVPISLDLKVQTSTKEFKHFDIANGGGEYICNENYGFDTIFDTTDGDDLIEVIYKAESPSEYVTKVTRNSLGLETNSISLFVMNNDIKVLTNIKGIWVETNKLTLDISNKESSEENMYSETNTSWCKVPDNQNNKQKWIKRAFKNYSHTQNYLFNKIIDSIDRNGKEKVIWEAKEPLELALYVSVCFYNSGQKYVGIIHKNYNYSLLKYTNDSKEWVNITESRIDLSKLKFYFSDENDPKHIQDHEFNYFLSFFRMNYKVQFDFPESNYDNSLANKLAKTFQYNLIDDIMFITFDDHKPFPIDPVNNNIKIFDVNHYKSIKRKLPQSDAYSTDNPDCTDHSYFADDENSCDSESLIYSDSEDRYDSDATDNTVIEVSSSDESENESQFKVPVMLNINNKNHPSEYHFNKCEQLTNFVCNSPNYRFSKIIDFEDRESSKTVIWSGNDPNNCIFNVFLLDMGSGKYLMLHSQIYKHFLYKWSSETKSWTDVTEKTIKTTDLVLFNEDGGEIDLMNWVVDFENFGLRIKTKLVCSKIQYKDEKLWSLREDGSVGLDIIVTNVLINRLNIFTRNGKVKRFNIFNDKISLISQDESSFKQG